MSSGASGGRFGFAQSSFQVGGNTGTALGPLAAALFVLPLGQVSTVWFGLLAVIGFVILIRIAGWFVNHQRMLKSAGTPRTEGPQLSRQRLILAFAVIGALLPLLAIMLSPGAVRVPVTVVAVLVALALTGVLSSRIGGSRARVAVVRVVVGGAAGLALTYAIGRAFGGVVG